MKTGSLKYFILSLCFLVSCNLFNSNEPQGNVIAEVGNSRLYLNDIESLFSHELSYEDSLEIIDKYRTEWIISRLLIDKATAQFQNDEKINKLVNDYRESLILDFYRRNLIKTKLDSIITSDQYTDAYEQYKSNFNAVDEYYNVKIVTISERNSGYPQFKVFWENNEINKEKLDSICSKGNTQCWLDDDLWLSYESILILTDNAKVNKTQLKANSKLEIAETDNKVFILVKELIKEGELMPIAMVKDELRKYILSNRMEDLLKETRNELYKKALEENKIKFNL